MDEHKGQVGGNEGISARDAAFERAVQAAMVRLEAPGSLMASLMAKAEAENSAAGKKSQTVLAFRPKAGVASRWKVWTGGAIAAALAVGMLGIQGVHAHREREQERVMAQQQFAESEAITQHALEHVREQMAKAGVSLDQ
ncbi:hypothetical protein ACFQBQ_11055 [Granulicella cerasi]|uniref:Uncharacterized protein n=1 Tax=Granulicella cerasi TaxID=741063 RepID=A0ABW1Z9H3_9BACT|nr:hypothetical protein [Granulicella cerasi]